MTAYERLRYNNTRILIKHLHKVTEKVYKKLGKKMKHSDVQKHLTTRQRLWWARRYYAV